ncbi:MAG: hypothetical protein ABJB47_06295 [Actinomycetota bacterium]
MTVETGEIRKRQRLLKQNDRVFERQPLPRVGGCLPRVAHRRAACVGVTAGGCGQEMGGELGWVHHGAFGSRHFERGAQITVQSAASRGG